MSVMYSHWKEGFGFWFDKELCDLMYNLKDYFRQLNEIKTVGGTKGLGRIRGTQG